MKSVVGLQTCTRAVRRFAAARAREGLGREEALHAVGAERPGATRGGFAHMCAEDAHQSLRGVQTSLGLGTVEDDKERRLVGDHEQEKKVGTLRRGSATDTATIMLNARHDAVAHHSLRITSNDERARKHRLKVRLGQGGREHDSYTLKRDLAAHGGKENKWKPFCCFCGWGGTAAANHCFFPTPMAARPDLPGLGLPVASHRWVLVDARGHETGEYTVLFPLASPTDSIA